MRGAASFRITDAIWPGDRAIVEQLFREYVEALGVDISFQKFEEEVECLPGCYARPSGVVLIARATEVPAGIGAYRMLEPGRCEMKRLYVRPEFRGSRIGRELAEELIEDARATGYRSMALDTLSHMEAARALYRKLGFLPIEPYYDNPLQGAVYLARDL